MHNRQVLSLTSQQIKTNISSVLSILSRFGRLYRLQYIPRNMHTVFALLCFVVVIHWLIFPYPSGLVHWHCGNLTIAPVPAKQPWWIWIDTSCEFIMNDSITTTKQSTTKPSAYFLGYTVALSFLVFHPNGMPKSSPFKNGFNAFIALYMSQLIWAPSQYKDHLIYVWWFPC